MKRGRSQEGVEGWGSEASRLGGCSPWGPSGAPVPARPGCLRTQEGEEGGVWLPKCHQGSFPEVSVTLLPGLVFICSFSPDLLSGHIHFWLTI